MPNSKDRACFPPPRCYSVYEKHLKSKIAFLPHALMIEVLMFWKLLLGQIHLLFATQLVGFIIIYRALGVPTSCDLFRRYYGVHHNKDDWYACIANKSLVVSMPSKTKDQKDRLFFLRDPYSSLKSSWTPRMTLPNPPIKSDMELLPHCNILDQYPLQLHIRENQSQALLESYDMYGGSCDRSTLCQYLRILSPLIHCLLLDLLF